MKSQLDLFRSPFHAQLVLASGQKAVVLRFRNKEEMRSVVLTLMRIDGEQIAYSVLCAWTGEKVVALEYIYHGDAKIYRDEKGRPICK